MPTGEAVERADRCWAQPTFSSRFPYPLRVTRPLRRLVLSLLIFLAAWAGLPESARAAQCGLPDRTPLWIDYGGSNAPIEPRPALILALSGVERPAEIRAAGTPTVFFDLNFNKRVGTPTAPADPATIGDKANRLFDFAVASTGCSTPLIALNELFGAFTTTPWSTTNAQYRANVLALIRTLAARGARVFLNVATPPYTGGEAGDWWRQVAQVAEIVREVFPDNQKEVFQPGPLLGSRNLREDMRQLVQEFTAIGVPASRLGLMLEFESGDCCRAGLPTSAWFEVIKLQALAARQVASELGISSIWSWGWATFSPGGADPDKPAAVCVYLWTRDQSLCPGPTVAGPEFDTALTEGQIDLQAGVYCSFPAGQISEKEIAQLARVTGDRELALSALLERLTQQAKAEVNPGRVSAAEQAVIALRFRGSLPSYLKALARAHATVAVARAVLADELRREEIEARLRVGSPAAAEIVDFYGNYGTLLTRTVEAAPAPPWLGSRRKGLAIASLAPAWVFRLPSGRPTTLHTIEGTFTVKALKDPLPLGALSLSAADPAIAGTLVRLARHEAYEAWLVGKETNAVQSAICRADDIPAAGAVDLTAYLPFLALT